MKTDRNLKTLGLVLAAIFAFGAVAASGAQAFKLTASKYPATLTAYQVPGPFGELGERNNAVMPLGTATCETLHGFGPTITGPVSEGEATTTRSGCQVHLKVGGTKPATGTDNGCKLMFAVDKELEADKFEGSAQVACPEGKVIETHVYNSATAHAEEKPLCTYAWKPQKISGLIYHNVTPGYVKGTMNGQIQITRVSGSALVCGAAEQTVTLLGAITLEALDENGSHIEGLHIG